MILRRGRAAAAAGLAVFLGFPPAAIPDETPAPPEDQERFDALVQEIGVLRDDLDRLDRRERGIVDELDRLSIQEALQSREAVRIREERRRAGLDLDRNRLEARQARDQVQKAERALAGRLRDLYIHGKQRDVRLLLAATSPVDLLRGVAYLDVMASRQGAAVSLLQDRRSRVESLEAAGTTQVQALDSLSRQHAEATARLTEAREQSAALLHEVREDAESHRRAIGELTRAAADLEEAIVAAQRGLPAGGSPVEIEASRMQGALEWPVPGRVAVPFGDITHPRFGTVTPHPGLDIETEPGAPVKAVLGGRVVFGRRFSGYGNTVLLDHGGRYFSVYARAAVLRVTEGQEVLPGQTLGLAPDAAADGGAPTIYFEWRHEGRTLDPARWLKRAGGTARPREGMR